MATFICDAIKAFVEVGMQDEASLSTLKSLQDRHFDAFPVAHNTTRYFYKVECPDDALTMHSSLILDTSVIDKASFAAMTANLEEVVFKGQWSKSDDETSSFLEMQVVIIDIDDEVVMALSDNTLPFPTGSNDHRPHFESIPKTSKRPWDKYRLRGIFGKNMKGLQWKGLYESNPGTDRAKALFRYKLYAPIHKMLDFADPGSHIPPGVIYGVEYPLRLPRNEDRKQWRPPGLLSQSRLNLRSCQEIEATVKERFPCPYGFDVFYFVPKMADMWVEAVLYGRIVPSDIRGYSTLHDSLHAALLQRCKQESTIMHHYTFVVHVRKTIITYMDGWYVHGRQAAGWNLARPRHNIGNNSGQAKMFVTEFIPQWGADAKWEPLLGYGEVSQYEGFNSYADDQLESDP